MSNCDWRATVKDGMRYRSRHNKVNNENYLISLLQRDNKQNGKTIVNCDAGNGLRGHGLAIFTVLLFGTN